MAECDKLCPKLCNVMVTGFSGNYTQIFEMRM